MNSFIVRFAEIGLKGQNRGQFESLLRSNIARCIPEHPGNKVSREFGRILVHSEADPRRVLESLRRTPGVANVIHLRPAALDMADISRVALEAVAAHPERGAPGRPLEFRVRVRRPNKRFPLNSEQVAAQVGADILAAGGHLKVNLDHPALEVGVEVWENRAVVYTEKHRGAGGLPVDDRNRVVALISGGIDSPVASWMINRRGARVTYLHFHSFPFVGDQSREKVVDLVRLLAASQPATVLRVAPFAEIQKAVRERCPERLRTLLYRRMMTLVANRVCAEEGAKAIVTGDNLAQVASQTLDNLVCTNQNAAFPVLRPLIGMDKVEIVDRARQIGTFELSIQDFPDCCTVFQPRKPATNATLAEIEAAESALDLEALVADCLARTETLRFSPRDAPAALRFAAGPAERHA